MLRANWLLPLLIIYISTCIALLISAIYVDYSNLFKILAYLVMSSINSIYFFETYIHGCDEERVSNQRVAIDLIIINNAIFIGILVTTHTTLYDFLLSEGYTCPPNKVL